MSMGCLNCYCMKNSAKLFPHILQQIKYQLYGVPVWISGLRTGHSVCEDVGLIHGLGQWVKHLSLPQAAEEVTDVAQIHCCYGCGAGLQLQFIS